MEEKIFEGFKSAVLKGDLGVYGIHVYKAGKGVAQCHFRDDVRVHLYSGSKAFASMAIGIAVGEGRLGLEDKALDFFPDFKPMAAHGAGDVTVKNLLHMRAGYANPLFHADTAPARREDDWAEQFFSRPMDYKPGETFFYDNGCTYILSRIIEAASGQTLRDYLMPRLFEPLDIFNPQWHTCPHGHSLGAVGLFLKTEEFSRLGILLLQNGNWQGRQLVPAGYIRAAAEDFMPTEIWGDDESRCGYGYQLWRCTVPGAYRADGKYGQFSIVLPAQESVVTVTAHNERCANDILRDVWKYILPQLQ